MRKKIMLMAIATMLTMSACKDQGEKNTNKTLSNQEIVTDSITIEQFQGQIEQCIAKKDTAKLQQLIGLSQTTYQKIAAVNQSEADAYASKVREIVNSDSRLAEMIPHIDKLVAKAAPIPIDEIESEEVVDEEEIINDSIVESVRNSREDIEQSTQQTLDRANRVLERVKKQASEKAGEAVEKAKKKANEIIQKSANAATHAVNKAGNNND